jgi:pyruvate/2-oxoglutarate dehydrogenase complex dihydrolipoamide dehydrogenase (E3) component
MKAVKARKDHISGQSNQGVTGWLESMDNVDLIRGHGVFVGEKAVEVGGDVLEAENIFLNVGARPFVPDLSGVHDVDFLTSSRMMQVDFLPEHLLVVGASYIGLEFGQMFRRFGSRVTIVDKGTRAIARDDDDVSRAVQEILEKEGVTFHFGAECIGLSRGPSGVRLDLRCDDALPPLEGSHVLLAVGRVPNTDTLGLDAAGIVTDERGFVQVDDQLRTNVSGVWALGDCNGKGAFTHTSYNDYEIVAANLFDDEQRRLSDRIPCYGLYVDPPLGRVGMTEEQARRSGRRVLIGKRPMTKVGRASERSETEGFMKVLVDADSREILGAAILGINGDEVVHVLLDVMAAGAPSTVIERAMHIHPTVAELLPTLLQSLEPLE